MSDFRKAVAWTAIPIVAVSIISTAGNTLRLVWFVAAAWGVGAILVALGFAIADKGRITSGMFAGIAIGFVSLGVTCFANLFG